MEARMSWFHAWNRVKFTRPFGSIKGIAWRSHEFRNTGISYLGNNAWECYIMNYASYFLSLHDFFA